MHVVAKKSFYSTHKNTRYSDSSLYDEVCEDCGLTDSLYVKRNLDNTPCNASYIKDKKLSHV